MKTPSELLRPGFSVLCVCVCGCALEEHFAPTTGRDAQRVASRLPIAIVNDSSPSRKAVTESNWLPSMSTAKPIGCGFYFFSFLFSSCHG